MSIVVVLFSLEYPFTDSETTMQTLKVVAIIGGILAFGAFGIWWKHSSSVDPHFPHVRTSHLILCCSDPRIQNLIHQWRKKQFGEYVDIIASPGVTPGFHHQSNDVREWTLNSIRTLRLLHGFHTLHLVGHHDCGGHGGFDRHGSIEEEKRYHQEDLEKTAAVIRLHFPDLTIHCYYMDAQGVHSL